MTVLVGLFYAAVGLAFALPPTHIQAWRLAAWVVCAVAAIAHIAYENIWLHKAPRSAALQVALAVAIGALGLAVSANIHSLSVQTTAQRRLLLGLSLVIWPVMTAVPAFVCAWAAGAVLARVSRQRAAS